MRKNLVWVSVLLMFALMSLVAQAKALKVTKDGITVEHRWIGFILSGVRDDYYGENVVAYEEESTAVLIVTIQNLNTIAPGKAANVSAVGITFDWKGTYSVPSRVLNVTNPLQIPYGESRIVTLNFTIPSISVATNLYLHSYTLSVSHISAIPPDTYTTRTITEFVTNFAVYSTVQADAVELSKVIDSITKPTFTSTRANLLWLKSDNETATARRYYSRGDFSSAKEHYEAALDFRSKAYIAEETYGVALEELQLKSLESTINIANSAGTFMVLFGGALVLFSIGYILKGLAALRKPSPPS